MKENDDKKAEKQVEFPFDGLRDRGKDGKPLKGVVLKPGLTLEQAEEMFKKWLEQEGL